MLSPDAQCSQVAFQPSVPGGFYATLSLGRRQAGTQHG